MSGDVLKPRADDVYLAAWPGTGAEVLLMMLHQLKSGGEVDLPHIDTAVPLFEFALYLDRSDVLAEQSAPRLFRTFSFPEKVPSRGRFIVLLRRPEDVAEASVRNQMLLVGNDDLRERALGGFLAGRGNFGSWFDCSRAWWARRNQENVLVLWFEEVLQDMEGTVRRVAEHCGLTVDADRLEKRLRVLESRLQASNDERFRRLVFS